MEIVEPDEDGAVLADPLSRRPAVLQLTPIARSIKITSSSCDTTKLWAASYFIWEEDWTISGTAQGNYGDTPVASPYEADLFGRRLGSRLSGILLGMACQSWTGAGTYPAGGAVCVRAPGDPLTTTWTARTKSYWITPQSQPMLFAYLDNPGNASLPTLEWDTPELAVCPGVAQFP